MITQEDIEKIRVELHDKLTQLNQLNQLMARWLIAVKKHYDQRGHAKCWENDSELYRVFGLEPGDPQLPPLEEHRLACDKRRASLYDVAVENEPCSRNAYLEKVNRALSDRVDEQLDIILKLRGGERA
jgi:hypothetical protein